VGVHEPAVWIGFSVLVVGLLVLDLGVLNRKSHVLSFREALSWSTGLVTLALLFGVFLWAREGTQTALEYYTGYIIELSLSVDNLFVFLLIFQYFAVPAELQPRILKWGILGALIMRAIMIALGALLLQRFTWIIYLFGGILIVTGIRMFRGSGDRIEPERNPLVRLTRRFVPMVDGYVGQKFIVHGIRGWKATPLLLVLLLVEWSDLVFAIDSIPAIFAVTRDPFIVYSSNVFAILGLRALFFVLAGMMDRFEYLKPGVAAILVFVGFKMLFNGLFHMPTVVSLAVIVGILGGSVVLSMYKTKGKAQEAP
jgi:tellurite resistance protein TerC